jgi:hypothetical protein
MNARRRISAPKLRGQHCIGSNANHDFACELSRQLSPGPDKPLRRLWLSNGCEGSSALAPLSQKLPNLGEKLTRTIRLRYEIIAARSSGFLFISAQGIGRDRDNWYRV